MTDRPTSDSRRSITAVPAGAEVGGVEASWWVTTLPPESIASIVGPYAEGSYPDSIRDASLWKSHGLRIVAVPRADLPRLRAQLQSETSSRLQWIGQSGDWTELVAGPRSDRHVLALENERVVLPRGYLRLLARSWIVPEPRDGSMHATIRLEIIPQLVDGQSRETDFFATPRPRRPEDDGLLFNRLLLAMALSGDTAYLIMAEDPALTAPIPSGSPPASEAPVNGAQRTAPAPGLGEVSRGSRPNDASHWNEDLAAGPEIAPGPPSGQRVPTIGEAMLIARRDRTVRTVVRDPEDGRFKEVTRVIPRHTRAIVVLVPHTPARFGLLPER